MLESIEVKAYRKGFSELTESHIDKTDVASPIILAEIRPGRYNVIDGNHRLEKAYRMEMEYIRKKFHLVHVIYPRIILTYKVVT